MLQDLLGIELGEVGFQVAPGPVDRDTEGVSNGERQLFARSWDVKLIDDIQSDLVDHEHAPVGQMDQHAVISHGAMPNLGRQL